MIKLRSFFILIDFECCLVPAAGLFWGMNIQKRGTKLSISHIEVLEYLVAIMQSEAHVENVSIDFTSFATI